MKLDCLLDPSAGSKTVFHFSKADFDGQRKHFPNYNDWTLLIDMDMDESWNLTKQIESTMV